MTPTHAFMFQSRTLAQVGQEIAFLSISRFIDWERAHAFSNQLVGELDPEAFAVESYLQSAMAGLDQEVKDAIYMIDHDWEFGGKDSWGPNYYAVW